MSHPLSGFRLGERAHGKTDLKRRGDPTTHVIPTSDCHAGVNHALIMLGLGQRKYRAFVRGVGVQCRYSTELWRGYLEEMTIRDICSERSPATHHVRIISGALSTPAKYSVLVRGVRRRQRRLAIQPQSRVNIPHRSLRSTAGPLPRRERAQQRLCARLPLRRRVPRRARHLFVH